MAEQLELPFGVSDTGNVTPTPASKLKFVGKRAEILRTAEEYVTKDRAAEHGDMEDNFTTIALYWSVHLGTDVTAIDVAVMMTLLKLARMRGNEQNLDNWVDGCGYLACGGELACRGE